MTTVAWDGTVLATDTQTTLLPVRGSNVCTVCKEKSSHCEFNEGKLTVDFPLTSKFRGERVLAAALSGDHNLSVSIIEALKRNEDIELILSGATRMNLLEESQLGLVIMTSSKVFILDVHYGVMEITDMSDKSFSIGSGRSLARYLIVTGRSAKEAVAECIKWDDYTGGSVVWTNRELAEQHIKHNYNADKEQA